MASPQWATWRSAKQAEDVRKVIEASRKAAESMMISRYPELAQAIRAARIEKKTGEREPIR